MTNMEESTLPVHDDPQHETRGAAMIRLVNKLRSDADQLHKIITRGDALFDAAYYAIETLENCHLDEAVIKNVVRQLRAAMNNA